MLYRGGAINGIIWIILTTCYRCTLSMTLLNGKNYSIYTMACNDHLSEATNATIMPCQSEFKWRSRMNKQILATSTTSLSNGEKIAVRKCCEPEDDLLQIYDTLKVDHIPIKARKFVWTQKADFKKTSPGNQGVSWNIAAMWVKFYPLRRLSLNCSVDNQIIEILKGHYSNNTFVDASAEYSFSKRLRISISATNLLNRKQFVNTTHSVLNYNYYSRPLLGRQLLIGVSVSY